MLVFDFDTNARVSLYPAIHNVEFRILNDYSHFTDSDPLETYLSVSDSKELKLHFNVLKEFLATTHEHLLLINSSKIRNQHRLWDCIRVVTESGFGEIDLIQFKYVTKRFKVEKPVYDSNTFMGDLGIYLGRNLASMDILYRNWIQFSRFFYRTLSKALALVSKVIPIKLTKKISSRINGLGHVSISRGEVALRRALNLNSPLIYHSFEKGIDCYLVSRKFASAILTVNNPALVNLNLIYSACARTQNLISIRVGKNFL